MYERMVSKPTVIEAITERILHVKNANACSNFGATAIYERKAFALKTKKGDELSHLFVYTDFIEDKTEVSVDIHDAGHGNGMTATENCIYIATCQKYILRLPHSGNERKKVIFNTDSAISGITFYGNSQFIARMGGEENNLIHFSVGTCNRTTNHFDVASEFYVEKATSYPISQDIHYYNGKLFVIYCAVNSDNKLINNHILVSNITSAVGNYKGKSVYGVEKIIQLNKSSATFDTYEVESLFVAPKKHIVFACNMKKVADSVADDGLVKISNLTF